MTEQVDDYAWRMRKLATATKNRNTGAVARQIDSKYMPEYSENKSK